MSYDQTNPIQILLQMSTMTNKDFVLEFHLDSSGGSGK